MDKNIFEINKYIKENPNWKKNDTFLSEISNYLQDALAEEICCVQLDIDLLFWFITDYIIYPEEQQPRLIYDSDKLITDIDRNFRFNRYRKSFINQEYLDQLFATKLGEEAKNIYYKKYPNLGLDKIENIIDKDFIISILKTYAYTDECKRIIKEIY